MSPSTTLSLGCCDRGAKPADVGAFVRPLHEGGMSTTQLRGDADSKWIDLREVDGTSVRTLQAGLARAGFLSAAVANGVFDYRTQSAARLFQEYIRSIEGRADIGTPDGVVGPRTQEYLERWVTDQRQADWAAWSARNATPAFRYWHRVLSLYFGINRRRPISRVVELVQTYSAPSDTPKLDAWQLDPSLPNLVGIRRQEWRKAPVRQNDDLFVLLVNGVAFTFFGSTDPNPSQAGRPDEAYLVRGQHRYRFGWHKRSEPKRAYRAFRPLGPGVLVCRDSTSDDALTDEDLETGLSRAADVNIHWSGAGTGNWSAGCQVISGSRYIDHRGMLVDCAGFASPGYKDLDKKTRGAYNVFLDVVTALAPVPAAGMPNLICTLIYERDLEQAVPGGQSLAAMARLNVDGLEADSVDVETLVPKLVRSG